MVVAKEGTSHYFEGNNFLVLFFDAMKFIDQAGYTYGTQVERNYLRVDILL